MELGVVWVVLIALGAFVLGSGGGWFAARRVRAMAPAAPRRLVAPEPAPTPTVHAGVAAHDTVDVVGDDIVPETSGYHLGAADAVAEPPPAAEPDAPAAQRDLDERVRYAQIIGIETENASLRAVAARVPALERRIRELEATAHERAGASGAVLDLTGTDPGMHRDADVTSG